MNCNRFRVHCWLAVVIVSMAISASAEWKEKVLYSFQGGTDGSTPAGGVVFDVAGNLYGATTNGGSSSCRGPFQCGVVYQLKPPAKNGDPWTETVLYVFKGSDSNDGASPFGGLIMDVAGNLYGTTGYDGTGNCTLGGRVGCGTVFELSPPGQKGGAWTESVIYNFQGNTDGQLPIGDLVFDKQGNLYGATQYGGGHGSCNPSFYKHCGTVFELSPPKTKGGKWTEKILHGFRGGTDGANPNGGLVFDGKGAIYGTAYSGGGTSNCHADGIVGCGTVFELKPPTKKGGAWTENTLHRFKGGSQDSNSPMAGPIWDKNGKLYGTTAGGQNSGGDDGAVYSLAPLRKGQAGWTESLLHRLSGREGSNPMAGLVFDGVDQLVGTASLGGAYGGGTVFRLKPTQPVVWILSVLHAFTGPPDGSYPAARATFDKFGNLYGTTQQSGYTGQSCSHLGCGIVFEIRP